MSFTNEEIKNLLHDTINKRYCFSCKISNTDLLQIHHKLNTYKNNKYRKYFNNTRKNKSDKLHYYNLNTLRNARKRPIEFNNLFCLLCENCNQLINQLGVLFFKNKIILSEPNFNKVKFRKGLIYYSVINRKFIKTKKEFIEETKKQNLRIIKLIREEKTFNV